MAKDEKEFEMRRLPLAGVVVGGLGSLFVIIPALLMILVKPRNPVIPGVDYVMIGVGVALVAVAAILIMSSKVIVRVTPDLLEFPALQVSVPWGQVKRVKHLVGNQDAPQVQQQLLLAVRLTDEGKAAIGGKRIWERGVKPPPRAKPHICVKASFRSYGPHDSLFDMVEAWQCRLDGVSGEEAEETGTEIPMSGPLRRRKKRGTIESRVYVHNRCGGQTVVSGSDFRQLCNPLMFAMGTICAQCGEAPLESVRWVDTGEKVSRFRSRMFHHTPVMMVIIQFLLLPVLVSLAVFFLAPLVHQNIARQAQYVLGGVSYFGGIVLVGVTPLGTIVSLLCGMRYWEYE